MDIFGKVIIVLCALLGFSVANYIRHTKKKSIPLVCPLEGSCEEVIYSKHSSVFGLGLETLGAIYYGVVALSYTLLIVWPLAMPPWFLYALLGANTLAFLLSIYLTILQAMVLKHWCTWCLISASMCSIIFIFAFITMNQDFLHMLGIA